MVTNAHRTSGRSFQRLILSLITVILVSLSYNPVVCAQGNRSLLFVVDTSEKMAPYLPSVKGTILTFAEQSTRGDYLSVITFSNVAKLVADKKISGDRKSLELMIDAINADGASADIARGLARAFEHVTTLKRKGDKNVKAIIVIAASQTPEGESAEETLEKAVQDISKYVDANEWYIQYCYLNGVSDPQIKRFISANNGLCYDVEALRSEHGGVETIGELYRIIATPERLCSLKATDLKGAALGKNSVGEEWVPLKAGDNVPEGTHIKVAEESQAVITLAGYGKLGLAPESDVVFVSSRSNPVTGLAEFEFLLETGSVLVHLVGKSENTLKVNSPATTAEISGKLDCAIQLLTEDKIGITSFSDSLMVGVKGVKEKLKLGINRLTRLGAGQTILQVEPAEPRLVEEWKSWSKALIGNTQLARIEFMVPQVAFAQENIALGPIKSGNAQSWTFPLKITGVSNVSKLKIAVEIALPLPEGLSLSTAIIDGEKTGTKALVLKLDGSEGFRSRRTETHQGLLKLLPAPDSGVVFDKISIPLTVITKGPTVPMPIVLLGAAAIILGALAYVATSRLRTRETIRPKPHRVIGRLIVISDPTGGRIGSINLEEISTKSSRLSLLIGRSKTAEVRLKHESVKSDHCVIEANLVGGRLETYIEPIGSAKVLIDENVIESKTRLNDGAKIGIGDFTYQFEDTQLYKKVDVVYGNGRRISGVLDIQGMDEEGFRISPMDAVSPSERARVRFSDIRFVTFYRRAVDIISGVPRPVTKTETMKKVEFMFKKGETISGLVQREYTEGRRRYIELLPLNPTSSIDYTVVDYSAVVEKRQL